jgi:choline dehydrogenase-like flavoprotein
MNREARVFQGNGTAAAVAPTAAVHDVVIIGSGAGGGTVTKVLTDLGVNVLLLEAGPMFNVADLKEHKWPYDYPHRGLGANGEGYFGRSPFSFNAFNGGPQLDGEPYTVAPGSDFSWFRSRMVGGRTNHYGRTTLRLADYDFKPYSTDGLGTDWPIGYEDIAPYYEKVERFIGVTGTVEGIRSAPDGVFQKPAAPKAHEVLLQRACAKLGIPCVPARQAAITQPTNGRPPCHYCGQCTRGCISASNYASSYVQIIPAMQTGRLQLVTNAMARELITDDRGRVTAVSYVDKTTRTERQVRCRTVVLAASACESARLLLNSRSSRHPDGLANASGAVGRYLVDSVGSSTQAYVPALAGMPHYNSDGYGIHVYMPWWHPDTRRNGFTRGYHIQPVGGFAMPAIGAYQASVDRHEGYGSALKDAIRDEYGAIVSLEGLGEMIPNEQSFCDIDPDVVDRWGIPVLRFHWARSDADVQMVKHMQETFTEILQTLGGRVVSSRPMSRGGGEIHEVGTVRMGKDPSSSVLNEHCQAHEVTNLFVADGGPFVSSPEKNVTHTIMALAWRTAEYLSEEMRKGHV